MSSKPESDPPLIVREGIELPLRMIATSQEDQLMRDAQLVVKTSKRTKILAGVLAGLVVVAAIVFTVF